MSGDWIKMRTDLLTSPKVVRISSALKADRFRTAGGLLSVWSLFDTHSIDGKLVGYTSAVLDELAAWPGFADAMMAVGWLAQEGEDLVLPRFDAHNGASAKRRAQDSDRKSSVRKMSASEADKMRTREEKRREEKEEDRGSAVASLLPAVADNDAAPIRPACPQQQILDLYHTSLPELRRMREWNKTRRDLLGRRWAESPERQNLTWWAAFFGYVRQSPFLMGKTLGRDGRPFDCDLEWLIRPNNFAKVVEGKYEDQAA